MQESDGIMFISYDIAVIGGGAAGCMAAIRAGELKRKTVLIERNNDIGRKILLTGKGRCNITNTASIDAFIEKFGRPGLFLRSAFFALSNRGLMDFFKSNGLDLKVERQGRVFPITDKASSVIEVLKKCLLENKIDVFYNSRLLDIRKRGDFFGLELEGGKEIEAKKVILALGGVSYKATGSTGDGFGIARGFGHTVTPLLPGLVPLKTRQLWVKELKGLSLKNVRLMFKDGKKNRLSEIGEFLFTHFGISGPLVLDLSHEIISILKKEKEINLFLDLKPGLTSAQLENKLINEFKIKGKVQFKNFLKDLLPKRLIPVFVSLSTVRAEKEVSQITKSERSLIAACLKAFPLTVTGSLHIEEAMVTGGGVSIKEINPATMESKIVSGLYFAGEIIEGCASSGGYNLQQAFSTGYLAGENACGSYKIVC